MESESVAYSQENSFTNHRPFRVRNTEFSACFVQFWWVRVRVSLQRQFKNSPFECFTCTFNIDGEPYWISECAAWKYSIFIHQDKNEMGQKKVNQIISDLNCTKPQKCQRISIGISTFFVLSSFRLPYFMWLSLSHSLFPIHTHTVSFRFCCHEIWILLFFFLFIVKSIWTFFPNIQKISNYWPFASISTKICQHKKKTFNSNKKCDSSITKLSSFSCSTICVFMPDSWTQNKTQAKTKVGKISYYFLYELLK